MFAYYFLDNDIARENYNRVFIGVSHRAPYIELSVMSQTEIGKVIRAVLTDNPGLFWFEGKISAKKISKNVVIEPHYLYDESLIKSALYEINQIVKNIDKDKSFSDYDKAKAAYDWIIDNVSYSMDNDGQNIYNAFIERKAVCKGLSKAFQFIMTDLGVFSTLVTGTIDDNARHIWNVVELEGENYNVDISLAYPEFDNLFVESSELKRYRTFLKSDADFIGTHNWLDADSPRLTCKNSYKGILG